MPDITCPNCNTTVAAGRFCSNCAAPLDRLPESVAPVEPRPTQQAWPPPQTGQPAMRGDSPTPVRDFWRAIPFRGKAWTIGIALTVLFMIIALNSGKQQQVTTPTPTPQPSSSPSPTSASPPSASSSAPLPALPKWQLSMGTSQMDSSRSATVTLEAENAIQGWMKQNTPTLIIRCRERKIDLYITTGMAADVEYGGGHTTRIRLDDGQPFSERWSESTDHEALFSPRALQLARKIAQAKTMRFQFTPFNASPAIVTFEFGIMKWPHSAA